MSTTSLVVLSCLLGANPTRAESPRFRIWIAEPGVYQVTFESLVAAGLPEVPVPSAGIEVSFRGAPVPIWLEDGGDDRFGPGDRIELVGSHNPGEESYVDELSRVAVYQLRLDGQTAAPARMHPPGGDCVPEAINLRARLHLERDQMRVRLGKQPQPESVWFWAQVTQISEPFVQTAVLSDLDPTNGGQALVRLRLRPRSGLPRHQREQLLADHQIELRVNGEALPEEQWADDEDHRALTLAWPVPQLVPGRNEITLRVVPRRDREGEPIIDAVLLDWIEIDYPRVPAITAAQETLHASPVGACLNLTAPGPFVIYGPDGTRTTGTATVAEGAFHVVCDGALRAPLRLDLDRPSDLLTRPRRVEYLIISHPRLRAAVEPLAAAHRRRGLAVEVVDVTDIYDELNHGIPHPRAIRDFIRHAHQRWLAPGLRYVLFAGDASWDTTRAGGAGRDLIPTWRFGSADSRGATDSFFVSDAPGVAIGRIPVTEPEELAVVVDKIVRYIETPPPGSWRRDILWLSDGQRLRNLDTAEMATRFAARGFGGEVILPDTGAPMGDQDRRRLVRGFARGQLLVFFSGHGGREVWRTAAPEAVTGQDIFRLSDLDDLASSTQLPVVLAMTCYSSAFDHPSADSIAEKLLRLPNRGAVAVIAASGRNAPTRRINELTLGEFTRPGTVGEALVRAEAAVARDFYTHQYNLLGDPAMPLLVPPPAVRLRAEGERVWGEISGEPTDGEAIIDWLGADAKVLFTTRAEIRSSHLEAQFRGNPLRLALVTAVRAYVWDLETGRDAIGAVEVPPR